jgi:pimeloyl-ACP methyl ester carboxylesterase
MLIANSNLRRAGVRVAFVALLCVGFALFAGNGQAAPTKPKISWSKCFSQFGPFQCGTVQVPFDYNGPSGGTISISVVRLPATDPARRIGSLFLNPGGPGGSGVDFTVFAGPFLYTDEVRARFDLVGFDPRGILRSTAFRCFGTPKQWEPYFTPFAFPMTPEQEQVWIAADRYLIDACDGRGGAIGDHMATANVARDLDVLRQAVGDSKLTYAGYSYGSYLGVTYANLFPNNVRALVVDGVLDPIAWSTGRGIEASTLPFSTRLKSDVGAQATLNEFFRLCDAGGAACAFSGGAATRYRKLADRLLAEPLVITFPDGSVEVIDYSILVAITLQHMYDSFSWPELAGILADLEAQAGTTALAAEARAARQQRAMFIAKRGFPRYPNFVEGGVAVFCTDSDNPSSYSAWSSAGAAADAANGYFGRIWTWISSPCAAWNRDDGDRYMGPFNKRTANPVLVVGTQFDPATRYEGAQTVAGLLPNSALLTVHGWGHTSLFLSQCADAAVSRYLLELVTPAAGTVCEQDVVPFSG